MVVDGVPAPLVQDSSPALADAVSGDWPRTTRLLPWLIAGFLVVLWMIPIDASNLSFKLPVDSRIDRFEIIVILFVWAVAIVGSGRYGPTWRHSKINLAVGAFLLVTTLSVVLNLIDVARAEELELAIKKLSLLFSYAAAFLVVATSIRRTELPAFFGLILGLATIAAIGTVVEYRMGTNYFYLLADKLPFMSAEPLPFHDELSRPTIVGPTNHPLAVAAILSMVTPLALVGVMKSTTTRRQLLYAVILGLLLAGAVATLRKTALVVPIVVIIILTFYQPRRMVKLWPLGIALVFFMQAVSPGALSGIRYQLEGGSELSNRARTEDYSAVKPDFLNHPLIGRGYGTYEPTNFRAKERPERHRTLDDEFLVLLLEIGVVGLIFYLGMGATAIATLHRDARSRDMARAGPALAIIAAVCAFFIANILFDTLAFRQAPYLFFYLLGFGVIASSSRTRGDEAPLSHPESPTEPELHRAPLSQTT